MARKKSSSAMSKLAARVLRQGSADGPVTALAYNDLLADARALAGSVLSQDETKGQDDA